MVLLDVVARDAARLGFGQVFAVHVNHQLSRHANEWAGLCARECRKRDVALVTKQVSIDKHSGTGLEAAARQARYEAFSGIDADWVLLAHHQDDLAETLLLNLLRGAGVLGAAAMPTIRGRYLRPMLGLSRDEIRQYADSHGLTWGDDESNSDEYLRRNFLRAQIVPRLRENFPAATKSLARAADIFAEATVLLEQLARIDQGKYGTLKTGILQQLSRPRALNLLACFLRDNGVRISARVHLDEILRQLTEARADRQVTIAIDGREIRRFREEVHIVAIRAGACVPIEWSGEDCIPWDNGVITVRKGYGTGLRANLLQGGRPVFSPRRGGERLRLSPTGCHRPLKDILREAGIAPWLRNRLPLMYCGDDLVWVPGIGVAAEYRCGPHEMGLLLEFSGVTW